MLDQVVNIISNHETHLEDGALFVHSIQRTEPVERVIEYLEQNQVVEFVNQNQIDENVITLELSLARLNSIGFYEDIDVFIRKNKYDHPTKSFYIQSIGKFGPDNNFLLFQQYNAVISFINSIKEISRHSYSETDIDYSLIFRDDKSLIIQFNYNSDNINNISENEIRSIKSLSNTFVEPNSEKQLLFINEMIDSFIGVPESLRFQTMLVNVTEFESKCNSAYQYYLRDFSYNKLKIELDSKALEFTQKIQSVINDSQTKLIAIPTAFLLVFVAFDFEKIYSIKNIASLISIFIFSTIIQVFLSNQFSILKFTEINIESYKSTFKHNNLKEFLNKFNVINKELSKQKSRLNLVNAILWLIPTSLLVTWLVLIFSSVKMFY